LATRSAAVEGDGGQGGEVAGRVGGAHADGVAAVGGAVER
jgi:hypothetical protein